MFHGKCAFVKTKRQTDKQTTKEQREPPECPGRDSYPAARWLRLVISTTGWATYRDRMILLRGTPLVWDQSISTRGNSSPSGWLDAEGCLLS